MARTQVATADHSLDTGWQLEQPKCIGNRTPTLAYPVRYRLVGQPKICHELLVCSCLLQRRQVLSLDVLD